MEVPFGRFSPSQIAEIHDRNSLPPETDLLQRSSTSTPLVLAASEIAILELTPAVMSKFNIVREDRKRKIEEDSSSSSNPKRRRVQEGEISPERKPKKLKTQVAEDCGADCEGEEEAVAEEAQASAEQSEDSFVVFVQTLRLQTYQMPVTSQTTIATLKGQIEDKVGVPKKYQRLVYTGRTLEDQRTLADYGIEDQAKIFFLLSLRGVP